MPDIGPTSLPELAMQVRQLEARIERLESAGQVSAPVSPAATAEAAAVGLPDTESTFAAALGRTAVLSFVLLGALILRLLTQKGLLGHVPGIIAGLVYAGFLTIAGLLPGRAGRWARETVLLPACGVVLAVFVAIEGCLGGGHWISIQTAMWILGAIALTGFFAASREDRPLLAVVTALAVSGGLASPGIHPEGASLQLSLMIGTFATGLGLSLRKDWSLTRPPIMLAGMSMLGLGALLAQRHGATQPFFFASAAFWASVYALHLAQYGRPGRAAGWLPAATVWFVCAGLLLGQRSETAFALATSIAAGTVSLFALSRRTSEGSGAAGLAFSVALAGSALTALKGGTGILPMILAVAVWASARRVAPGWSGVSATILLVAGLIAGVRSTLPETASWVAVGSTSVAALCSATLYAGARRRESPRVSGVALVITLLLFFAALRLIARILLVQPAPFLLAQTGILVASAILLTALGHFFRRREIEYCGFGCSIAAMAKVGLIDLFGLNGAYLLASVILLGLSSTAVAIVLKRRPRQTNPESEGTGGPG